MRFNRLLLSQVFEIFTIALMSSFPIAKAQSASEAATPPMGWNSWNHFGDKVNDANVRATADAMVSSGMRDAGYIYVNVDDTWEGQRDAQGNIHPNSKFPDMKALADYVHSRGLKFGIYSSPGPKTCGEYEGSYGHEQQDADTYAMWGVDFLKYDLCSYESIMQMWDLDHPEKPVSESQQEKAVATMQQAYEKMHQALLNTHWLFSGGAGTICRAGSLERSGHAGDRQWGHDP